MIEAPRTINSELLRTFSVVAETRHFTAAAERLNASQSAVSMQIQRLEESLQTRLLERSKREVRVTQEGEILLRYAHRVMRLTDETLTEMGRRVAAGKVRVGATDTSMCYLPEVLQQFYARYPAVDVELHCDRSWNALDALEAGDIDLAFVSQCCGREGGRVVTRSPLVWACLKTSDVDECDPVPLAIFGPGCIYRKAVIDALNKEGKAFRLAYESASRSGLDCAVAAGLAVTVLPQDCTTDNMRIIAPRRSGFPELSTLETYLFGASPHQPLAVRAFSDLLTDIFTPAAAGRPASS